MRYQITVRHGARRQRYHTYEVDAHDAATALHLAADRMPPEIVPAVDLVEMRVAVDPDARSYVGE
jgi:hypothetical protein